MRITLHIILFCILVLLPDRAICADREMHSDYFMRIAQSENKTPRERTDAFRRVLEIDSTMIADPVAFPIIRLHNSLREYDRADSLLNMISRLDNHAPSDVCQLLHAKAWTAFYQQDYARAMENALNLLKEKKPDTLSYRNADAYLIMADIFNFINNYPFGERCARRALDLIGKITPDKRKKREIQALICLANSLLWERKQKEAFISLKRARELDTDSTHFNAITGTMASVYSANGDNAMAENYFREALNMKGEQINKEADLLNLVVLKLREGDYEEAANLMNDNASILRHVSNANLLRGKLQIDAYIMAHKGNMEEAFATLDRALEAADSAHAHERDIYTRQMSAQFEEQLANIELRNSLKHKIGPWLWIIGGLGMAAIVYRLVRNLRRRRRKEIDEYKSTIEALSSRLDEMKGASEADMEVVNQRLMGMAMHLARVTESLDKIDYLAGDSNQPQEQRMKEIKMVLRQLSSEDNLWEMFKTYFEQVNQSFFNNLFIVQPNLTNAEVRMAAFVYLNLTSKEIAAITNRSVRTVDSIKYNLRKKLAINEPTEVFMRKIALADKDTLEAMHAAITQPLDKDNTPDNLTTNEDI